MFIHEAIRKAVAVNGYIVRSQDKGMLLIKPTDSQEGVIVRCKNQAPCPRWQPHAEDLMADDWTIATEELI